MHLASQERVPGSGPYRSGSRLSVSRKRRTATATRTRAPEKASWFMEMLLSPPRTSNAKERAEAPITIRAWLASCPWAQEASFPARLKDNSSCFPASSRFASSNEMTTLPASMNNMTATNSNSRTAVSGAAPPRRSRPTFPPMTAAKSPSDALLARASFLHNIPNDPTEKTIPTAGTCNPKKASEGTAKRIKGDRNRYCSFTTSCVNLRPTPTRISLDVPVSPSGGPVKAEHPAATESHYRSFQEQAEC